MTNFEKYKQLQEEYKIAYGTKTWDSYERRYEDINLDEYDIVVENIGSGYAHSKYKVVKNKPNLSMNELALICDKGNLCFGYRTEGNTIVIHTD